MTEQPDLLYPPEERMAAPEPPPEEWLPTVEEMAESLTGFDELAIEARFGKSVTDLSPTISMRAMTFITNRRGGMNDKDAYRESMEPTLKMITAMFRGADQDGDQDGDSEGKG